MSGIWIGVLVAIAVVAGRRAYRALPPADERTLRTGIVAVLVLAAAAVLAAGWWATQHQPIPEPGRHASPAG